MRLRILISGTMAKARRKPEKTGSLVRAEKVNREKSSATCKAMPIVGLYMVAVSAAATKTKYMPQIDFWCPVILSSSFGAEVVLRFSFDSSAALFGE